jgi:uncharacterized protein involved in response to NO
MTNELYRQPRPLAAEAARLWQAYLVRVNDTRRYPEFHRALLAYVYDRGLAVSVVQWPTVWPSVLHLFSKGPTPEQDLVGVIRFVSGVTRALRLEDSRRAHQGGEA